MKRIFLIAGISAICTGAFAQNKSDNKFHFSIGPEISFASGNFNNTHSIGIGATFQPEGKLDAKTNITLTTGYISYAGRSAGSGIKYKSAGVLPLKGGVKYFLSEGFYGAAQIGIAFFENYGTPFAYTPMIGYEFETKSGKAVDAGLKYDGYASQGSGFGCFGFRLAYRF